MAIFSREDLAEDAQVSAGGSGFKSFSLAYNLPSQQEVDKLFEEFREKDVTIRKEPQKVFWGGYSGYISDPEDNLWEISYNPYMQFDDEDNVIISDE